MFRREAGVRGDDVDFHSFSWTVVAVLENARVPLNEIARIVGNEQASVTLEVYSSELMPANLQEIVERIEYPDLGLSHRWV